MIVGVIGLGCRPAAADDEPVPPINPDRPGIADGSTVIFPGRFQIESGLLRQTQTSGGTEQGQWFLPTLLRFGINQRWEARVETPGAFSRQSLEVPGAPETVTNGYSPISVGFKHQFRFAKPETGNLSLGTIFRVFPPSGSTVFKSHHVQSDLRLAGDWTFSPQWDLNPNVGIARYEDASGKTFFAGLFAMTLTYNPSKRLQPFVDMGLVGPEQSIGGTAVTVDGGATYLVNNNLQLDVSAGHGVAGSTVPDYFWAVGVSQRWGAPKQARTAAAKPSLAPTTGPERSAPRS